jgi:hypothetical protein
LAIFSLQRGFPELHIDSRPPPSTRSVNSGGFGATLGRLIRVIRSNKGREVTAEQIGVATVSKRADLHPKATSKTRAKTSPLATVQFGSPVLLAGEDDTAYRELLSRVRTAINPVDIIDEMFIADAVSSEWEVLRWRRLKSSLMRTCGLEALKQFLSKHLDYNDHYREHFEQDLAEILQDNLVEGQSEDEARALAHECARNESDAVDKVNQILASINLDMDDVLKSVICSANRAPLT